MDVRDRRNIIDLVILGTAAVAGVLVVVGILANIWVK